MENTNIEWADHTFNPWMGCTKVSPACDHCYAENLMDNRMHIVSWGAGKERKRTSEANWKLPLKWNKEAQLSGKRFRVFCASLADVFDNEVPIEWRTDLFHLIEKTPHLDWLLLTKRIGNVKVMMGEVNGDFSNIKMPGNVWLGITVCNQEEADRDIPKLLNVQAQVRFLSIEPLLSNIDLTQLIYQPCPNYQNTIMDMSTGAYECCSKCDYTGIGSDLGIDWVIVGGESGAGARPMHPDWVRGLRDQCHNKGVPFLFKQWGEWVGEFHPAWTPTVEQNDSFVNYINAGGKSIDYTGVYMARVGKKQAGRMLDGVEHTEFPKVAV